MFIYYTLSKIWPPHSTLVDQTVESLDEDAHDLGNLNDSHGWEKDNKASTPPSPGVEGGAGGSNVPAAPKYQV